MTDNKKQPPKSNKIPPQYLGGATPYSPPEEGIGGRIKVKRTALNLNVEELARLTESYDYREHGEGKGISASMLRRYESGGFKPGAREICLLCDALDVSADWLLRDLEPKNEATGKQKAADALFNAVSSVITELGNKFSETSTEHANDQWKNLERTTKLSDARQTSKQAK